MELVHSKKLLQYKLECSQSWSSNLSENALISKTENNIVNFCFAMSCSRNCFMQAYNELQQKLFYASLQDNSQSLKVSKIISIGFDSQVYKCDTNNHFLFIFV